MLINNVDISTYHGKQFAINAEPPKMNGMGTFGAVCLAPGQLDIWREIKIDLYVEGDGRDEVSENISGILSLCRGVVEIVLNGGQKICGVLQGWSVSGLDKRSKQKLTLKIRGYKYRDYYYTYSGGGQTMITANYCVLSKVIVDRAYSYGETPVELMIKGLTIDPLSGEDRGIRIDLSSGDWQLEGWAVIINGITGEMKELLDVEDTEGSAHVVVGDAAPILYRYPMILPGDSVLAVSGIDFVRIQVEGREIVL